MSTPKATRSSTSSSSKRRKPQLPKTPTGIAGLDEITAGGLPSGLPQ